MNSKCDRCEKLDLGIGPFAAAYREQELLRGHPDPGTLCGRCAGTEMGHRIACDILLAARLVDETGLLPIRKTVPKQER